MTHYPRLHNVTKQWSSHEETIEYSPDRVAITHSRSYSQSTRSISTSTSGTLQLDHSNNPIQYRSDWKKNINSNFGFVRDAAQQMNHNRHARVFDCSEPNKEKSQEFSDFELNYLYSNKHRFCSAYNQRLAATHSRQTSKEKYPIGEQTSRLKSPRLSNYQNETIQNLTVKDFVNKRYRSPKPTDSSFLIKQSSWETGRTNNSEDIMSKKNSENLQIDKLNRQKLCDVNASFEKPSTYRPLQKPYSRSQRESISSIRKPSFQSPYGNAEVTIGIETLSLESSSSPDYENLGKDPGTQDFLSVNRYNINRGSLSKQRSCESPPVINEEFSYAQKYKSANYRQKSCDSPTNFDEGIWNHPNNDRFNKNQPTKFMEERFKTKSDNHHNELGSSRYQYNIGSHSDLLNVQPSTESSNKKKLLSRQPSMDLKDHRSVENHYGINEVSVTREKNSDSPNNLDYLFPTRYGSTYSRTPITKQRSCEIGLSSSNDDYYNSIYRSNLSNNRPSSSNYDYNLRSSFENMKQPEKSICRNKFIPPDSLVSTSSTDLRHLRKSKLIYSTGADQLFPNTEYLPLETHQKVAKRYSIKEFSENHNNHLELPMSSSKLVKQLSCDTSNNKRLCTSNSNSPSKIKVTTTSPISNKLSKQHRKFSHDSQSQRKSIKSDKSIWSQAILTLKKKRAMFFGKRSEARSTEKNAVDPVYHFLKCTANIDHNPEVCECPCHTLPDQEILFHAHSSVNLPAIAYKSKHK